MAEQLSARRIRMTVVTSTFVSPASIFCRFLMFKSTISANFAWAKPLATRSRRTFAPNRINCSRFSCP